MALAMPEHPLEEIDIELNDRQNGLLSKYRLDRVERIKRQIIILRERDITNAVRDELLSNAETEVKALVAYAKSGGFARDFVILNNKLNEAYISIRDAITDPALRNVEWAEMIAAALNLNFERFITLVHIHEQDLRDVSHHIQKVVLSITAVLKHIISYAINRVKEIFENTLELVKTYALPASFLAVTVTAGAAAFALTTDFALCIPACINPIGMAFVLGGIAALSITAGAVKLNESNQRRQQSKRENDIVERVGLRSSRDFVQDLMRAIEDKKYYEEDRGRDIRRYREVERMLSECRRELETLIGLRV